VIVVVPIGKILLEGTPLRVIDITPEQLSPAVAIPSDASLTTFPHDAAPGSVFAVTAGGAVIVGGVLSSTLTFTVSVLVFMPSETVRVIV
jgi:hypothetical protein